MLKKLNVMRFLVIGLLIWNAILTVFVVVHINHKEPVKVERAVILPADFPELEPLEE